MTRSLDLDDSFDRSIFEKESTYRFRLEDKYKDCLKKKELDEIAQEVLDLLSTKGLKVWQVGEVFRYARERLTWMEFK